MKLHNLFEGRFKDLALRAHEGDRKAQATIDDLNDTTPNYYIRVAYQNLYFYYKREKLDTSLIDAVNNAKWLASNKLNPAFPKSIMKQLDNRNNVKVFTKGSEFSEDQKQKGSKGTQI